MKPDTTKVVDVRAVDIGYFSTKLTLGRKLAGDQSYIATQIFPSLAPRLSSGVTPYAALQSKQDGTVVTVNGVHYFVGRDVALHTSGREPREVLDNYSQTDKYMALLKGALHYMFLDSEAKGELVINRLVLGLPLNTFNDNWQKLTKLAIGEHILPDPAAPEAMRRVTVNNADVLVQPQGAQVNYGLANPNVFKDGWVLVVDAGGGTLDWYVARGRQHGWNRSGAYPKSMLDCAYAVADRINPNWRDNINLMERIDNAIRSKADSFQAAGETYMLADYSTAIEAVLKESVDKMESRLGSYDDLDLVLFTGGGGTVFMDYMKKRYPKLAKIMRRDEDTVFSNVKGFQIAGEIMSRPAQRA